MFYLLNFKDHSFVSCNDVAAVRSAVQEHLLNNTAAIDDFEIVDCSDPDIRMDMDAFNSMCENYGFKSFHIRTTMWHPNGGAPEVRNTTRFFLTQDEAHAFIRKDLEESLAYFNQNRKKEPVYDSDGNIVCHDYPFRNDPDGDEPYLIRFWDGDDYRPVAKYEIIEV